jgi:glutaredoxin
MLQVEIYTLEECVPCQEVKRLLQDKGIVYKEYRLCRNPPLRGV